MAGEPVVVAGAGAAGLAAAGRLQRAGIPAIILERTQNIGASWRSRYDGLRLNTLRWTCDLPGYRMERGYGRWPSRDQWVAYLERYAAYHRLDIRFDTELERVDRADGGWRVQTSAGPLETDSVVIATGFDRHPHLPDWPGREGFEGELLHAAAYRNPAPFRGKDVLIVGPGNTGSEVAFDVLRGGAARVRASMRTPPNIVNREQFGLPLLQLLGLAVNRMPVPLIDSGAQVIQRIQFGDLSKHGLPRSPIGMAANLRDRAVAAVVDDGFVDAVKRGEIAILPATEAFEGPDVVLAGGARIQPDVVIACTGYERGLEPVIGHLGVLSDDGRPLEPGGGEDRRNPGLYFIGYIARVSGQIREFRYGSRRIARSIRRRRRRR